MTRIHSSPSMACPRDPVFPTRPNFLKFFHLPVLPPVGYQASITHVLGRQDLSGPLTVPFHLANGCAVWNMKNALRHIPAFVLVNEGLRIEVLRCLHSWLCLQSLFGWGCIPLLKALVFMMSLDFPVWHKKKRRTNLLESSSSQHAVSFPLGDQPITHGDFDWNCIEEIVWGKNEYGIEYLPLWFVHIFLKNPFR